MDNKKIRYFDKRDYANRHKSFDGFEYQSKFAFSDSDLNQVEVLKTSFFFDTIKAKSDMWDLVIEDIDGGDAAGLYNPYEQQIILDCRLLKQGFYCLRDCYIHELTHKHIGLGHGTNFFIMCCVISCRYYKRKAGDLVPLMRLYECQDVRVYDGLTYTPLGHYAQNNALEICAKIGDCSELDFYDFIVEIEFLASSRYTIEAIADYLEERENLLIYV